MLIKIIISFLKVFTQVSSPPPLPRYFPQKSPCLLRQVLCWGLWNPSCHPSCLQARLLAAELRQEPGWPVRGGSKDDRHAHQQNGSQDRQLVAQGQQRKWLACPV